MTESALYIERKRISHTLAAGAPLPPGNPEYCITIVFSTFSVYRRPRSVVTVNIGASEIVGEFHMYNCGLNIMKPCASNPKPLFLSVQRSLAAYTRRILLRELWQSRRRGDTYLRTARGRIRGEKGNGISAAGYQGDG